MSGAKSKQVGDLVEITGGRNKTEEGILHEKTSKGWNVKLKNGQIVLTSFPFIVVLAKKGEFEEGEPWKSILVENFAEDQDETIPEAEPVIAQENTTAQNAPESPCTAPEETGDEKWSPRALTRHRHRQAPPETAVLKRTQKSRKILRR